MRKRALRLPAFPLQLFQVRAIMDTHVVRTREPTFTPFNRAFMRLKIVGLVDVGMARKVLEARAVAKKPLEAKITEKAVRA